MITTDWFGVFSPKGELEAVESTRGGGDFCALNLSPKVNGIPQLNRTVEPVTVIRGDVEDVIARLFTDAVTKETGIRYAELQKAEKLATAFDEKSGQPITMSTPELQAAREKFAAAVRLLP